MKNYVTILKKPFLPEELYKEYPEDTRNIMLKACRCQYCKIPSCSEKTDLDIRGIMRRVSVGNFYGARTIINNQNKTSLSDALPQCEERCILNKATVKPVEITSIIEYLLR